MKGFKLLEGFEEEVQISTSEDELSSDDEINESGIYNIQERFNAAATAIKENQDKFQNSEMLYDFFYKFRDVVSQTDEISGSFLHIAVGLAENTVSTRPINMGPFVQHLLKEYPHLIKTMNGANQTPLSMAILNKNWTLVESMTECSGYPEWQSALEDSLEIPCGYGDKKTCLHIALQLNLRSKTIHKLINCARDTALATQDEIGKTPMHYAVSHSQLTVARAELIEKLIERDEIVNRTQKGRKMAQPLETFLDILDFRGISVYQQLQEYQKSSIERLNANSHAKTTWGDPAKPPKPVSKIQDSLTVDKFKRQEEQEPEFTKHARVPSKSQQSSKDAAVYTSNPDIEESKIRNQAFKLPRKKKYIRKATNGEEETNIANREAILNKLKLHYLRTRDGKKAITFLYGKNIDDIQISFDYYGLPLEIEDSAFETAFQALKFDNILQYVSFPKVSVTWTGMQAFMPRDGGQGRRDMDIHVEDMEKPSHKDESIIKSLENISIDSLDWQKVDLDPRTISGIGRKVKQQISGTEATDSGVALISQLQEITLYWSGNNAVLRAWSEAEGLSIMPNLVQIYIHVPPVDEMLDPIRCMEHNLTEFRMRIEKNTAVHTRPEENFDHKHITRQIKISVLPALGKEQNYSAGYASQHASIAKDNFAASQWLDSVYKFAQVFKSFWFKMSTEFNKMDKDVVVALIDDGVDAYLPSISGRVIGGKSFDYKFERVPPYYVSEYGHGTVIASMVMELCPLAKLYPIRIETEMSEGGERTIVSKSAALAIEAALDKNATIILMPWSIPISQIHSRDKRLIDAILDKACSRNTLMFCPSSDKDGSGKMDYPAAYRPESFFRIGAARVDGKAVNFTEYNDMVDFIFPGAEAVKHHNNSNSRQSNGSIQLEPAHDSSVATALGAGLAAIILYCFKAIALAHLNRTESYSREERFEPILRLGEYQRIDHNIMMATFQNLGTMTDHRFIKVWESLDIITEALEKSPWMDSQSVGIRILLEKLVKDIVK
ncbi:hypothetical protein V8C37DRAFT_420238 [Trichoderma ceciliae]